MKRMIILSSIITDRVRSTRGGNIFPISKTDGNKEVSISTNILVDFWDVNLWYFFNGGSICQLRVSLVACSRKRERDRYREWD